MIGSVVVIQYQRVTDRQIDGRTERWNCHISIALCTAVRRWRVIKIKQNEKNTSVVVFKILVEWDDSTKQLLRRNSQAGGRRDKPTVTCVTSPNHNNSQTTRKSQHSQECKDPCRHCFLWLVTSTFDFLTQK